jgi:hypothetical protein
MADHADHGGVELGAGGIVDMNAHLHTYSGFLKLLKYSCIGIVIILILMAFFLL